MDYKIITNNEDLNIKNEPFDIIGRMIVNRINDEWSYDTDLFLEKETQTFPDENYDLNEINKNGFAIGAYDGNQCVGVATFADRFFKYMYLDDLKVKKEYRHHGIAAALIKIGLQEALKRNYAGLCTVGQDNNLAADLFYLKQGFKIGGLNTNDYKHTPQEGKSDIYFYLDYEKN